MIIFFAFPKKGITCQFSSILTDFSIIKFMHRFKLKSKSVTIFSIIAYNCKLYFQKRLTIRFLYGMIE